MSKFLSKFANLDLLDLHILAFTILIAYMVFWERPINEYAFREVESIRNEVMREPLDGEVLRLISKAASDGVIRIDEYREIEDAYESWRMARLSRNPLTE